jgi:hypothetical protein
MAGKRGNGENSIYQYAGRWHVQGWVNGRRRRVSRSRRGDAVAAWERLLTATPPDQPSAASDSMRAAQTVADALEHWFRISRARWAYSTSA